MHLIEHPFRFRAGTRVLFPKGRHKDGLREERTIMRVSHDAEQLEKSRRELQGAWRAGERACASAGAQAFQYSVFLTLVRFGWLFRPG